MNIMSWFDAVRLVVAVVCLVLLEYVWTKIVRAFEAVKSFFGRIWPF